MTTVTGKVCSKCKVVKTYSEFYKDKSRTDGHTYQCKECQNGHRKVYLEANPKATYWQERYQDSKEQRREVMRKSHLQRKYGITAEQYAELLFLQGGRCAICPSDGGKRRLCVDHDHKTGKVRGLLCNTCNAGLGQFDDDIERLESAVAYLKGRD